MIASFADLIAPISRADFAGAFRERKRLYGRASDPTRAQALLPWPDIEMLLSRIAAQGQLIVIRDGVSISKKMYTSPRSGTFNSRAFRDLIEHGVSVVVHSIDDHVTQIGHLAVAIERELGTRTRINGYFSFSRGGAFPPHWDAHDVLILQIHGHKTWRLWTAEVQDPTAGSDRTTNTDPSAAQEIGLASGDVLFIPRGEPHAAAVLTGHSVHLTIGLESLTGLDFLDGLRKQAAADPILRKSLPRRSQEIPASEVREHEACLKAHLHRLIDAASIDDFVTENDRNRPPREHVPTLSEPPQMNDGVRLTLRRRIPLPDVASSDAPQHVVIGGGAYHLCPASIAIVRWLFDHDPSTREELRHAVAPHYGPDAFEASLTELQRFGFVVTTRA